MREQLVDRFVSRDDPASDALFAPTPRLAEERWPEHFDFAVGWSSDPEGRFAANLAALATDAAIVVPSRPEHHDRRHQAQYLLDSLGPLGVQGDALAWPGLSRVTGPAPVPAETTDAGPLIVLHPGSGSPGKNWPAERFLELAGRLEKASSARIVLLTGPAEAEIGPRLKSAALPRVVVLVERPLEELAALLARCSLYLGNDSGMSHLAGMSTAPSMVLFGPTDPLRWRPLGPRVRTLRHEPLGELSVEAVWERTWGIWRAGASRR